jgi:hypothetical protein
LEVRVLGQGLGLRLRGFIVRLTERVYDGNKFFYMVFVGVVFFSASCIVFRAVRTAS